MSGTATFSLEIELGWGLVQYRKMNWLSEDMELETQYLRRLLNICDNYDIKFSFDVVGHLLLSEPLDSYHTPHDSNWFEGIPLDDPDAVLNSTRLT